MAAAMDGKLKKNFVEMEEIFDGRVLMPTKKAKGPKIGSN